MINLSHRKAVPEYPSPGLTVGAAPCIFCGVKITHVNDGGRGCVAGAWINGHAFYYLYCNDPMCLAHRKAQDRGQGITTCSCENYRAYDVVPGYCCPTCKQMPCSHLDKRAFTLKHCPYCEEPVPRREKGSVRVKGLGEGSGRYCSSACLFNALLKERTNQDTWHKVREVLQCGK
jgi:hypothetical protein